MQKKCTRARATFAVNRISDCTKGNVKTFWRQFINTRTILLCTQSVAAGFFFLCALQLGVLFLVLIYLFSQQIHTLSSSNKKSTLLVIV